MKSFSPHFNLGGIYRLRLTRQLIMREKLFPGEMQPRVKREKKKKKEKKKFILVWPEPKPLSQS